MTLKIEDIRIGQTLTVNLTNPEDGDRAVFDGQVVELHANKPYNVVLRSSDIGRGVPADQDLCVKLEELSLPDPRPIVVGDRVVFHPRYSLESVEATVTEKFLTAGFRVKIHAQLRESSPDSTGSLHKAETVHVAFEREVRRIPGTYPEVKKEPGVFAVGDKVLWVMCKGHKGLKGALAPYPGDNPGNFDFCLHNEKGTPICAVYTSELTHVEG